MFFLPTVSHKKNCARAFCTVVSVLPYLPILFILLLQNMKLHRHTIAFLFIVSLIACSTKEQKQENQPKDNPLPDTVTQAIDNSNSSSISEMPKRSDYKNLDPKIRETLQKVEEKYAFAPFYFENEGELLFVTSNSREPLPIALPFKNHPLYGVVTGQLELILPIAYHKVYNLDVTMANCMEIDQGGKKGMFNPYTKQIVKPRFDLIVPSNGTGAASPNAYGLENGLWYEITSKLEVKASPIDIAPIFAKINFNAQSLAATWMYNAHAEIYPDDPVEGNGVLITPSYIEHLNIMPDLSLGLFRQDQAVDFGLEQVTVQIHEQQPVSNRVLAFFVSFFEQGVDARGYSKEYTHLVTIDGENNKLAAEQLSEWYENGEICGEPKNIRFIESNLLEVQGQTPKGDYDTQPSYTYYKILDNGELVELNSKRKYNFTEFADINTKYFEGCFASYIDGDDEYNYLMSYHLTIEELDIMRNEIFASYGYIFKTEKWKRYFNRQLWYEGKHDNVDDLLTDRDKANVKVILERKAEMEGQEEKFIQQEKVMHVAAG